MGRVSMQRRGFSLIEVLVVLAAVLILSSVLVPVFAQSRDDSRSLCQQNIRMIGLGIKQYVSDYDESFPIVRAETLPYGWADAIQPYVRNTQIFQCPGDKHKPPSPTRGTDGGYTDYFYNSQLSGVNEIELNFIAHTVMLGDAKPGNARRHSNGGADPKAGIAQLVNEEGDAVGTATRHEGGANYTFADGHVKWFKGSDANTCPIFKNAASGVNASTAGFAVK